MRLLRHGVHFALIALAATLCLVSAQQGRSALAVQLSGEAQGQAHWVADENAVVLPTGGTLDERPFFSSRRHPEIAYSDRPATDVVGELARKVDAGSLRLRFEGSGGYLLSILEALHVPAETQSVVFSKTSLQAHWISPSNPRAIFYSDDVSVAFIRNAPLLEISALDPRQGVVFYAVVQRQVERPQIVRSDSCLSCHESRKTLDVPGLLARSVGVGDGGEALPEFGNYASDHRSPLEERWGGWFITGKTGSARHMGNLMLAGDGSSGRTAGSPKPLTSLSGKFDLDGYPSRYSDVAAVMVLNHQVGMTNLLTRVGWETRIALDRQQTNPQDKVAVQRLIAADAGELTDYMLFVDEAPLHGKFESSSGFQMKFADAGPRDSRGRSLRQLDLDGRLMRYPCSYMIYSRAFDELPSAAKDAVYARLWAILSGTEKARKYSKLSHSNRAAIVGILLETKPDLPAYYRRLEK